VSSLNDRVSYIVNKMNSDEKDGAYVYILLRLKDKSVEDYINKFFDTDKKNMTEFMLDNIESIIRHSKTIYEIDRYVDPFDDVFYDRMLSKFKKFRPEPFGNNGIGLANAKYKYDELSGTLNKTHYIYNSDKTDERDSLEDYLDSIPISNNEEITMMVNHKKDGTSVTIDYRYEDGYYVGESAISRGKKDYGEGTDVSPVIPSNKFTSKHIKKLLGYCPKYIGVQNEFMVSNENKIILEDYLKQRFTNNRSAAAGLLRRIIFANKEERKILKKCISLVPVGFHIDSSGPNDPVNTIPWNILYETVCKTFLYGNIEMEYDVIHGTKTEILRQFEDIAKSTISKRGKLNNAIDGLVGTILDKDLQLKLGRKNNINKWQIAYKFPEEGKKTVIRDVIITTGNFGYKEILLKVDPVVLNGTTQFKAQVHSLNKFKKMKLRIGDEIILKLSGDVIPFGYKDSTCREGTGKKIKLPKYCECGAPLEEEKNKLRCINKRCPYRIIGSLNTFFTELNAKGIGEKTCAQLHDELGVTKPSQILKLTADDFKSLKGFKDASAKICMNTINDIISKPRTIASIMSAVGIDSFRTSTANKLLEVISAKDLIKAVEDGDKDKLISVIRKADGIDKNASVIAEGLIDKIDEIKNLINIMTIKKQSSEKYDKTIVVSGLRNDEELIDIANKNGYEVKDSGKKFDLLVIKDSSMMDKSKAKYALSKSIPIMTRSEFINKYSG
jgi:NAD-dependent DNA ligase